MENHEARSTSSANSPFSVVSPLFSLPASSSDFLIGIDQEVKSSTLTRLLSDEAAAGLIHDPNSDTEKSDPKDNEKTDGDMPPKPSGKGSSDASSSKIIPPPPAWTLDSSSSTKPSQAGGDATPPTTKKKRHRGGRKRNRRQSFAAPPSETDEDAETPAQPLTARPNLAPVPEHQSSSFYKLSNRAGSNTSLESEALLDHREQNHNPLRPRRPSVHASNHPSRPGTSFPKQSQAQHSSTSMLSDPEAEIEAEAYESPSDGDNHNDDRAPLLSSSRQPRSGYGGTTSRRRSNASSVETKKRMVPRREQSSKSIRDDYDINNPPSVPGSPRLGDDKDFDDVMLPEMTSSPREHRLNHNSRGGEAVIDIDQPSHSPHSPGPALLRRRGTGTSPEEDVCMPFEQMTEIGEDEEDYMQREHDEHERVRRHHRKAWPDLGVLEEWSREEKKQRSMQGVRAKKENEPVLIGGRLRPQRGGWRREEEEKSFRWTYFNEEFDSSLRSHSISELEELGNSFKELFIPEPTVLDDSSSDEDDEPSPFTGVPSIRSPTPSGRDTRQSSVLDAALASKNGSGEQTPSKGRASSGDRPKRYGPRPVFWLDVCQPTWEEMKVLSRAFGIHKLTAEDIMEQEAREKVELFRNYYFVNYRTFEQDEKSEDYLDAVNMYFIVFKGGVISFHFSQMPHPALVRRRIRQLAEHQYTDSDWIAYAIIDNITDAYAPLIEQIEKEVDDIDDAILQMHHLHKDKQPAKAKSRRDSGHEKGSPACEDSPADTSRDMLLRVGECRKRVMSLYRLLGNKADVIKGLAKRCNEQWQVAPRSDVGLYLGDIQDHIVTMTANLTHYESILSRAHSNYLAQINIGMNERAEQTNDVLGKLTVLGTIVLPMNIVTGMWGMNCLVPGQVEDNPTLTWFFALTTFLILFGLTSFFVAKKVYRIV